jgi:ATP-binding cassette subfamily B protein
MKNKAGQILAIFLFLVVQVYCDLTLPQYTADIVNIGIQNTDFNFIISIGEMMLLMVAISALATVGVSYFSSRVSSGYAKDLRKIIYGKVLKFSNHELNNISRSSLITRSTNDVNHLQSVLGMIFTTLLFAPTDIFPILLFLISNGSDTVFTSNTSVSTPLKLIT